MFTQLLSSGPAVSTPNAITSSTTATNAGRGSPNWLEQFPTAASTHRVTGAQNPLDGNLRNPYTQRWCLGFQRQLRRSMLLDLSYIGSESHRLTTRVDWNPRLLTGMRPYTGFGQVTPRTRLVRETRPKSRGHENLQIYQEQRRNKIMFSVPDRQDALELADDVFDHLSAPEVKFMHQHVNHRLGTCGKRATPKAEAEATAEG
jgi:hypothetical protein